MSKTLVMKSARSIASNEMGTVIPIGIEDENGSVHEVGQDDYPNNNRIFISKDYSRIDETYDDGEIFLLSTVNENRDYLDEVGNSSRSKYYSMGFYASALETNTYLPVVSMKLPDIASGRVEQGPPLDIGNKHFFINNNNFIFGPFLAQAEDDSWLVTPTNTTSSLGLSSYHIAKFSYEELSNSGLLLTYQASGYEKILFTSLKRAKELVSFETEDYIPDSALIRLFAKNDYGKGVGNLTKTEASKLATIIETYSRKMKVASNNDRTKRIKSILNEYIKFDGIGNDVVQEYLTTKSGKEFVENYTILNKEVLLKDTMALIEQKHSADREKFERETAEFATRHAQKKQELASFELEIERKKRELVDGVKAFSEQTKEQEENKLRDRHNKIMAEISANERALDELKVKLIEYKDLDSRKTAVSKLDVKIELLREQEDKLKRSVQTQMNLIGNPQVADKLVEFRTIQMLLNGISPETTQSVMKCTSLNKYSINVVGETRKSYIAGIKNIFDKNMGRQYTYDEIANLLLCVMQSYITILAGPPGTGKTSTVNRFADALGISSKTKNSSETDNFLSVSVGRGWMSSRDLLGFHNSLKNIFQPSRSGLYSFLRAMTSSGEEGQNEFLKLVLLDEANLSSVEHYWSDFLLFCDSIENSHKIDLGVGGAVTKENYLVIPQSLRFIATINKDATVESLSHRLIDRASIIGLDYDSSSNRIENIQSTLTGAVPYLELMEAFCPKSEEEELQPIEALRLGQILDLLSSGKGSPIRFSKRKTNAIARYCYAANQLDYEKIEPLDFAISQHILPAINGQGAGLRERLQQLEVKLDEFKYNISRKVVSRIIENSDDFSDSYSYF